MSYNTLGEVKCTECSQTLDILMPNWFEDRSITCDDGEIFNLYCDECELWYLTCPDCSVHFEEHDENLESILGRSLKRAARYGYYEREEKEDILSILRAKGPVQLCKFVKLDDCTNYLRDVGTFHLSGESMNYMTHDYGMQMKWKCPTCKKTFKWTEL